MQEKRRNPSVQQRAGDNSKQRCLERRDKERESEGGLLRHLWCRIKDKLVCYLSEAKAGEYFLLYNF